MKNWTDWKNEEYSDCEHCFIHHIEYPELVNDSVDKMVLERYPDQSDGPHAGFYYQVVNDCIIALDKMVLERYPNKNDGPHAGFYYQEQSDGVPIMPCGGVIKCSFRMWGELMANIASKRDGITYDYMDFAWV